MNRTVEYNRHTARAARYVCISISARVRTGVNITWQQYFHRVMAFCKLDVCGSVHHSTILTEKPNKMQQCINILLFHI
jgi:hypothetical protein